MKKALFLTDCSIDSALSLNQWLASQPDQRIDLTVSHAYDIPEDAGYPLKASSYRVAKQEAIRKLSDWVAFLPHPWPGQLTTKPLLGTDQLVLTIHLLLRQYDYLLLSFWQEDALSAFVTCQNQISTELHWLDLPEEVSYSLNQVLVDM